LWPAVAVAAVIIALLIVGTSVLTAFQHQQHLDTQPPGVTTISTVKVQIPFE